MGGTKVTRKDIHKAESLPALITQLVKRIREGNAEVKEHSAAALRSIAQMDHGEHAIELYKAGAVKPLVDLLKSGTTDAQSPACAALASILAKQPEHQNAFVDAGGVPPLVALLKMGSAKVQEEVRAYCAQHCAHRPSPPPPPPPPAPPGFAPCARAAPA